MTMDAAPENAALGREDDVVQLDVDHDDLFAKLTQGICMEVPASACFQH